MKAILENIAYAAFLLGISFSVNAQVKITPEFTAAVKQYDVVQTFHNGMAAVMKGGKWGYINEQGKEVIPCTIDKQFDVCCDREDYGFYRDNGYVRDFSEGMVAVAKETSGAKQSYERVLKWGYMDASGRLVVDYIYDEAADFSEGLAYVSNDAFHGFIDKQGNKVVDASAYYLQDAGELNYAFHEGLACVMKMVGDNTKYGFIDKTGKEVIPCTYDVARSFSEGKAAVAVYNENNTEAMFPYQYSFINTKGEKVCTVKEGLQAGSFHEGLASVTADEQTFGFVDTTGTEVIPQRYYTDEVAMPKFMYDYHEGYTLSGQEDYVGTETFTVYRLMDHYMVRPNFQVAGPLVEGAALYKMDGKFGFVKADGSQVVPCKYDATPACVGGELISTTYRFSEGVAAVRLAGKWGYVDQNGNSTF